MRRREFITFLGGRVDPVNLKQVLGNIEPDHGNVYVDGLIDPATRLPVWSARNAGGRFIMQSAIRIFIFASAYLATIATALSVEQAKIPPKTEIIPTLGHTMSALAVAFSPDGRFAVSASRDNTFKLWDVNTGRLLRTFRGHKGSVEAVAFSPDGLWLASGSDDKTAKLWDAKTGQLLRTLEGHKDFVKAVAFTSDGHRLLSGGGDNDQTIRLWDVETGKLQRSFGGKDGAVNSLALSPDGKQIISGIYKFIEIWDIETGKLLRKFQVYTNYFNTVALSPDGRRIGSASGGSAGGGDGAIKLWNADTGQPVRTFRMPPQNDKNDWSAEAVAISPDGKKIVSGIATSWGRSGFDDLAPAGVGDDRLQLWDSESGQLIRKFNNRTAGVNAVAFSPDGRRIISAGSDGSVDVWDTETGRLIQTLGDQSSIVTSISTTNDGQQFLAHYAGKTLALWDSETGRLRRSFTGDKAKVDCGAISPDGRQVVAGLTGPAGPQNASAPPRSVRLWDAETAKVRTTLSTKAVFVCPIILEPDGSRVAFSGYLLGLRTGQIEDAGVGKYLAFSQDDQRLVSTFDDGTLQIWDVNSGNRLRSFKTRPYSETQRAAFSPDGRLLLTLRNTYDTQDSAGPPGPAIKLWRAETGEFLRAFVGHDPKSAITSIAFSADGRRVLSGGMDRTVKLWDTDTAQLVRTFDARDGVNAIGFTMGGRNVVSGNGDGTIKVWQTDSGELLANLIATHDDQWLVITPEGFFDASESGAELLHIVQGFETTGIEQVYQALYRPDLVREKLAGDPRGLVRDAAAKLDLDKVLASGNAPMVTLLSPPDGDRASGDQVTADVEIADKGGGVGRVEWRVNGVTVGTEDRSTAGAPAAPAGVAARRLSRGLLLDEGDNEIEVVAYNSRNLIASVPARATVTGPAPATQVPPRLFVLAVGLNDYADPNIRLNFAVPDAQALADAFAKAGKGLYQDIDVTLLRDAEVTRSGLDASFTALAAKVRPTDVFVFFIAGHGKTVDGRYYFIPQDFKLAGLPSILSGGVPQEQWQDWFSRISAKRSVLLFDTCESASLTGDGKETRALEQGAASARLVHATGRTIMTAATGDALEGFRGHGLFTYNLIEALERADSNGDGKIEVAELAAYVYAQVTALSDLVFKEHQEPQIRITGNDYALASTTVLLGGAAPGLAIATKPTHRLAAGADIIVQPTIGARRVHKLDTQTPVTLVRTDAGWDLVAVDGKPIGYVAASTLAPIQ